MHVGVPSKEFQPWPRNVLAFGVNRADAQRNREQYSGSKAHLAILATYTLQVLNCQAGVSRCWRCGLDRSTAFRAACPLSLGELLLLLTLMRNLRIVKNMERAPMAVVETKEFLKQAKPLMSDSERADLVAGYPREA